MPKYLPPPHKFRPKTLNSTDTVDFTHFRRTVNRYCGVLLKDHNAVTPVRLEPAALQSRVKHSITEPLRSQLEITCRGSNLTLQFDGNKNLPSSNSPGCYNIVLVEVLR